MATPPDQPVWTPIRGALGSVWWRRKQALEVAIHRADAQVALGGVPETIDAPLALDGIDEYAEEFLPRMLRGSPSRRRSRQSCSLPMTPTNHVRCR